MAKTGIVVEPELTALRKLLLGDPSAPWSSGIVCSYYWAEEVRAAIEAGDMPRKREFRALYRAAHKAGIYPPDGNATTMRACLECGRDCPASSRESGHCADCQEEINEPDESPAPTPKFQNPRDILLRLSVFVKARDADGRIVLLPKELAGEALREHQLRQRESLAQLRREMAKFNKGKWKPARTP